MKHYFDVDIAKEYGIQIAILLSNLEHWIAKNEANEHNFHDGRYWTYNSVKAFGRLFPYMTERQISEHLRKMEEHGLILKGNYNENPYDRTCWYALTDKANTILHHRGMVLTASVNEEHDDVKSCARVNVDTDINTDINKGKPKSLKDILGVDIPKTPEKDKKKEYHKKRYVQMLMTSLEGSESVQAFYEFLDGLYDKGKLNDSNVRRLIDVYKGRYMKNSRKALADLRYSACNRYVEIYDDPNYQEDGVDWREEKEQRAKSIQDEISSSDKIY